MNLLIQAIPALFNSKNDLLMFFRGAGVSVSMLGDLQERVAKDRKNIDKYFMTRTVLQRLNEAGERALRERREILKRIVEFDDFSTLYANNQLPAKGLVAEIRRVVEVKDSFTRMQQEKDREIEQHRAKQRAELEQQTKKRSDLSIIKQELYALFALKNPWNRGKQFESLLNRLFAVSGFLIKEAFTIKGDEAQGIIEQIDGVVQFEGHLYLVEVKWHDKPLGTEDVSPHLVRVYSRGGVRGLFISASGYSSAAIETCKSALTQKVVVLSTLEELIYAIEYGQDLSQFIQVKVVQAVTNRNPFHAMPTYANPTPAFAQVHR
ncbi:MAG: restriction endonuclease [Candidatus Melainabacteria bacterium]|nr:restriction endonuclease [Candidatus Melainabacteria bacterium]